MAIAFTTALKMRHNRKKGTPLIAPVTSTERERGLIFLLRTRTKELRKYRRIFGDEKQLFFFGARELLKEPLVVAVAGWVRLQRGET